MQAHAFKERTHDPVAQAFAGVDRTIDRVLAPYDVSKFELPETLRAHFMASDNLIRAVSIDVRRSRATMDPKRLLRWGNFCADWLELREKIARQDSTFLDLEDQIETSRTYALGVAEELVRNHKVKPAAHVGEQEAPAPKKKNSQVTDAIIFGAVGLAGVWILHRIFFGGGASAVAIEEGAYYDAL
jgi:hypothetical protein